MALLNQAFDSNQHKDMTDGFEPLPRGEYLAKIVESDVKATAKGNGKYIKLKFEIIQGEFKGRFVWTNLNIINPNQVAVEIAQKELATLCRACGKSVIQDTQQLHGIPIKLKLKIKPAKGDYPPGNEPCGYSSAGVVSGGVDPSETPEKEMKSESKTEVGAVENYEIPWDC